MNAKHHGASSGCWSGVALWDGTERDLGMASTGSAIAQTKGNHATFQLTEFTMSKVVYFPTFFFLFEKLENVAIGRKQREDVA
jgi:hypothetical protein